MTRSILSENLAPLGAVFVARVPIHKQLNVGLTTPIVELQDDPGSLVNHTLCDGRK